jgi:hypothetical protein
MNSYGSLRTYDKRYGSNGYINPSNPEEIDRMNLSKIRDKFKVTTFPETFGEPFIQPYYACFVPRSTKTAYIYNVERDEHPQHFSRYGYARCANGYCFGHMPGKYVVSDSCVVDPQPNNVAPDRFYSGCESGPCLKVKSKAYEGGLAARNDFIQ